MADFAPTPSQKAAIEKEGCSILVSAAAGSGKTRVLTERMLRMLEEGADLDSFLIITFTKAAAAELRGRISDEIAARLALDPTNAHLRKQSAMYTNARIGTIDSYCQSFLHEHCHAARLSPDFTVIEEDRAKAMRERIIERVLDESYERGGDDFLILCDTVGAGTDDGALARTVLSLHSKIQSHSDPMGWLHSQLDTLTADYADAGDTPWGRDILNNARAAADYWAHVMDEMSRLASQYDDLHAKYTDDCADIAEQLRNFSRACSDGWDAAYSALFKVKRGSSKSIKSDPALDKRIGAMRKKCKACIEGYYTIIYTWSDKALADLKGSVPAARALIELTERFDSAYKAEKRRRSEVDFADLEHMTVQLLYDADGRPSEIARETGAHFKEIMVDEYQDVNRVQDDIFRALSDDGKNLFMVGDVKQSIYRFRLADPTIFIEKYDNYAPYGSESGSEGVKIMLRENFRSSREVIDGVNSVFGTIMSRAVGEVSYDEDAALKCGRGSESGKIPELTLISTQKTNDDDLRGRADIEAAAVAEKIRSLMASGVEVEGRPLEYDDIAILMRSANSVGEIYRRELILRGIPVASGDGGSFFRAPETAAIMSLLAIIDDPRQDVALIAVLSSAVFDFTADELSEIRLAAKDEDFFTALVKSAEKSEKCADFLETLASLRERAKECTAEELLRHIYDALDIPALCSAQSDPARRLSNLRMMLSLAHKFSSGGFRGLHRFITWLQRLDDAGGASEDESGGVRIMTVHKSKGLEFPVVFLCDTARGFNMQDSRENVIIHPELGIGIRVYDTERKLKYPGISFKAIGERIRSEQRSEEMRLLYVALTRARDRLYITAGIGNLETKLSALRPLAESPMPPAVLSTANSLADWLIYAAVADDGETINMDIADDEDTEEPIAPPEVEEAKADDDIIALLKQNLAFKYPYAAAPTMPSKITATGIERLAQQDEEAESAAPAPELEFRKPNLGEKQKLTPARRGTATHLLLQHLDIKNARTEADIDACIDKLLANGMMTPQQAAGVDRKSVLRFLSSPVAERMRSADDIKREFKFSVLCPAELIFPDGGDDSILLQGVIDCLITEGDEISIIDYKTDRVFGDAIAERAEKYSMQLASYAYAAGRITGKKVKECVLCFLASGKTVTVPTPEFGERA